jgi:uncharacterized protein DUF2510
MVSMDELDRGANCPGPSWHADPLSSTPRLRWWSGEAWTASVVAAAADVAAIAWQPELAELPPPIQWGTPVLRLSVAPPLHIRPLAPLPGLSRDPESPPQTGGGRRHGPRRRRRRRHLTLLVALLPVLAVAGVASAALLTTGPRPAFTDTMAYRDGPAGFSLTYATNWKIQRVNPGQGVRFVVSSRHASADQQTTVSVTAGTQHGPLPTAADLARTVTDGLRPQFPGIMLATSGTTTLADGPAVLLTLTDPGTKPPTAIEQVVGRTRDGRPLTVTIEVPDPRFAPSDAGMHNFLTSITS